ncbi:hypothetical protein [Mycobacterium conspicuum]|jgi:hypothetical protein|uniref:Uncharacterized protein n=1 Tax=Mycobacterium conspicuum TaxID=44010 RepID=A0A1X1TGY1_9MYCO|nr:hypothetical protein [Mycobacterium conspicuum]ORV43770.1 hypothetical protein AWC00_08640 [Mycobacterium conspicuum]BBZ38337.1 hypothetical protein MCNS_14000 [Mycobacterium conspicuum]
MPNDTPAGRAADIVGTIVVVIVHGVLWVATYTLLGLFVMVTDPCGGSRPCGDPAWIGRAMWLGLGAGGAVFVATLVVAIMRLVRHRLAFVVPLIGCAAQLALGVGAVAMEFQAGPVS